MAKGSSRIGHARAPAAADWMKAGDASDYDAPRGFIA
jgi:hypothetical protein